MSELTREQIEEYRSPTRPVPPGRADAICDMALRTLDAEARIRELEAALRRISVAPVPEVVRNIAKDALATTPPPESEPDAMTAARCIGPDKAPPDSEPPMGWCRCIRSGKRKIEGRWCVCVDCGGARRVPRPDSEPAEGERCPVCEKGKLTRIECCVCDTCDANPVLSDQIRRNDERFGTAPPQRRDALEAMDKIEREVACGYGFSDEIHAIRRALSAGVPEAFSYVDVTTDGFEGHINLFWGEYPVALVPPPAAHEMRRALAQSEQGRDVSAKYHELLYAVATKHPGESRHETALRYIRQAEDRPTHCAAAPQPQEGESDD